jgi:hypothetical protein
VAFGKTVPTYNLVELASKNATASAASCRVPLRPIKRAGTHLHDKHSIKKGFTTMIVSLETENREGNIHLCTQGANFTRSMPDHTLASSAFFSSSRSSWSWTQMLHAPLGLKHARLVMCDASQTSYTTCVKEAAGREQCSSIAFKRGSHSYEVECWLG